MDNVIKKTNLGIAVQDAIVELKLEREKAKIMSCLQRAFEEKYEEFKKSFQSSTHNFKGSYVVDNQFPIGEGDKQQHFRSIVYQAKLQNNPLTINTTNDKRPFTLIESFSKNEDNKKRPHSNKVGTKTTEKKLSAPRKIVKK